MHLTEPTVGETVLRLALTIALCALIGAEREARERPAGLRTHVLVGLGSCLFMMVSIAIAVQSGNPGADPARIAANVVTGIGFLGAGTIWLRGDVIRGLTTAASIWATAAIGLCVGMGWYFPAVISTLLTFASLTLLRLAERKWFGKGERYPVVMRCTYEPHPFAIDEILQSLTALKAHITRIEFTASTDGTERVARIAANLPAQVTPYEVARVLQRLSFIRVIEWE
ncbi:MAG: MgtC/SapB family protein [Armatimonadota bacterium]|nr:MgtC/SapB family protein [Armatimonadota bacterium]MCX7778317.1 MgtC/SapB family protein [Armatimonadota bacterium]MDW8025669.1 MgtC/SapB family protein [Armatimonadota bacterium]